MGKCEICGKPTSSHEVGDHFVCYTTWAEKSEEVKSTDRKTSKIIL